MKTQNDAVDEQESRAIARKPRDAAAAFVLYGLKFANNIHYQV